MPQYRLSLDKLPKQAQNLLNQRAEELKPAAIRKERPHSDGAEVSVRSPILGDLDHLTMCRRAPQTGTESATVQPQFKEVPMAAAMMPGWSKPSSILFASEIPANEKALSFAVAQAMEFGANLILFHAYDTMVVAASETSGIRYYDYAAAARAEIQHLEPLARSIWEQGVPCEIAVRPGLPADQILAFLRERKIDRIVMGTHSPGPIGKLLVGSVAEAVLRRAKVPVFIVGPDVVDGKYRKYATSAILCAVSLNETSETVAAFAADLAMEHDARLVLQHVIKPQERVEVLAGRTIEDLEEDILSLIPEKLQKQIPVHAIAVLGDPTEELLYQARAQQAELIVMGAQGASAFAAIARSGVVYKVLAQSHCPVMTLSPALLADCGVKYTREHRTEVFLAGVF
jgi:nucleotide-binding universal stress UspA family protein